MDASEQWNDLPVYTIPNHHHPKWMFFENIFFKSSLLLNGYCGIQVHPPTSNDELCLLFCIHTVNPSSKYIHLYQRERKKILMTPPPLSDGMTIETNHPHIIQQRRPLPSLLYKSFFYLYTFIQKEKIKILMTPLPPTL